MPPNLSCKDLQMGSITLCPSNILTFWLIFTFCLHLPTFCICMVCIRKTLPPIFALYNKQRNNLYLENIGLLQEPAKVKAKANKVKKGWLCPQPFITFMTWLRLHINVLVLQRLHTNPYKNLPKVVLLNFSLHPLITQK